KESLLCSEIEANVFLSKISPGKGSYSGVLSCFEKLKYIGMEMPYLACTNFPNSALAIKSKETLSFRFCWDMRWEISPNPADSLLPESEIFPKSASFTCNCAVPAHRLLLSKSVTRSSLNQNSPSI